MITMTTTLLLIGIIILLIAIMAISSMLMVAKKQTKMQEFAKQVDNELKRRAFQHQKEIQKQVQRQAAQQNHAQMQAIRRMSESRRLENTIDECRTPIMNPPLPAGPITF